MNKQKCNAELVVMAAAGPQAVSGCIRLLTEVVNTPDCDLGTIDTALRGLRGAGVSVDAFVAAYQEEEPSESHD